jgi:hypothetical protein
MSITYKLEELNSFRKGRFCTNDIFTIWQITEKSREFNPETHTAFIDYEEVSDRVNPAILW